jgi:hypothetical protein
MCESLAQKTFGRYGVDPLSRAAGIEPKSLGAGLVDIAGKLTGGGTPALLASDPVGDQAKIDAESAAKGAQARTARRRRIRASSLLASGGQGDQTDVVTGQAYAKPTLGA